MSIAGNTVATPGRHRVLIVEDDPVMHDMFRFTLDEDYDVDIADSGEAGLSRLAEFAPDLVLLDIGLPGIDGYETCRRLRQDATTPVIFISSHEALEDRLAAFDAGGNDFMVKPFVPPLLLRKVRLAIQQKAERDLLESEKVSLQKMAMGFLTDVAQGGILLKFMREVFGCSDYLTLGRKLLETTAEYGLRCHVRIRHPGGKVTLTPTGAPTELEESVLDQTATLGRTFRFKQRLVINFECVSLLVDSLPDDQLDSGRVYDNLAILVEAAEAIAETISMRKESMDRAEHIQIAAAEIHAAIEALRAAYQAQLGETRVLLETMVDGVEKTYYSLGLSESQEELISNAVRLRAAEILKLFERSAEFDRQFAAVLAALMPGRKSAPRA